MYRVIWPEQNKLSTKRDFCSNPKCTLVPLLTSLAWYQTQILTMVSIDITMVSIDIGNLNLKICK